jgi:hypothetical protein
MALTCGDAPILLCCNGCGVDGMCCAATGLRAVDNRHGSDIEGRSCDRLLQQTILIGCNPVEFRFQTTTKPTK